MWELGGEAPQKVKRLKNQKSKTWCSTYQLLSVVASPSSCSPGPQPPSLGNLVCSYILGRWRLCASPGQQKSERRIVQSRGELGSQCLNTCKLRLLRDHACQSPISLPGIQITQFHFLLLSHWTPRAIRGSEAVGPN